jgi:hypothetical protein
LEAVDFTVPPSADSAADFAAQAQAVSGAVSAFRGGAVGWRGGAVTSGPGWGWRRGWGWGAAAIDAGLAVSSYYYPNDYYGGYDGYDGYGGCILQPRLVLTRWGYRKVQVQVRY